jgi:hypothetical protein
LFILWNSINPCTYSFCQRDHVCCLARSSHFSSWLVSSLSIHLYAFCPQRITLGVRISSSPWLLSTYVNGRLFRFHSLNEVGKMSGVSYPESCKGFLQLLY